MAFAQDEEESEAQKFMRISCEKQRVALACYNYANMLIRANKEDQSEKYFEIGCKLEHSPSCSKDKWVIPEVVIKKKPKKSEKIETENEEETSQAASAFDLKAPDGYKGSTSSQSSATMSDGYSSSQPPSPPGMDSGQPYTPPTHNESVPPGAGPDMEIPSAPSDEAPIPLPTAPTIDPALFPEPTPPDQSAPTDSMNSGMSPQ